MIQSTSTDFLVRIKNGSLAGRKSITAPGSKYCASMAALMKKYGYIEDFSVSGDFKKTITINLSYRDGSPAISDIRLFSRPGRRIYEKTSSLPWGATKNSLIIVSTSAGVMSQKEAKKRGLGGEIVAEVY